MATGDEYVSELAGYDGLQTRAYPPLQPLLTEAETKRSARSYGPCRACRVRVLDSSEAEQKRDETHSSPCLPTRCHSSSRSRNQTRSHHVCPPRQSSPVRVVSFTGTVRTKRGGATGLFGDDEAHPDGERARDGECQSYVLVALSFGSDGEVGHGAGEELKSRGGAWWAVRGSTQL